MTRKTYPMFVFPSSHYNDFAPLMLQIFLPNVPFFFSLYYLTSPSVYDSLHYTVCLSAFLLMAVCACVLFFMCYVQMVAPFFSVIRIILSRSYLKVSQVFDLTTCIVLYCSALLPFTLLLIINMPFTTFFPREV